MITNNKHHLLACSGGYAILGKNDKLYFVNYQNGWLYTVNFILLVLLLIFCANGIYQLFYNLRLGLIFLFIAIIFAIFLFLGIYKVRSTYKKALKDIHIIAVIDFDKKLFMDKNSKIIAKLDQVHFMRSFQLFSSSYAVLARWPTGSMIVARGNPFDGGSTALFDTLTKKGLIHNLKNK